MKEQGRGSDVDFQAAAQYYKMAAEQGNANAMFRLGLLYQEGKGVEKNGAEATQWLVKAADGGNMFAQINLAIKYEWGAPADGIERNINEAIKWYEKASKKSAFAASRLENLRLIQ